MQNFFLMIHFNEWGARMYDELQHRHLFIHAILGLLHECAKSLCEAICVVKKCSLPNYVTWSVREIAEAFFFNFFEKSLNGDQRKIDSDNDAELCETMWT